MAPDDAELERVLRHNGEWSKARGQLKARRLLLAELSKLDGDTSEPDLNAIDLFVEKAQIPLGQRGNEFKVFGAFLIAVVVALVLYLISRVMHSNAANELTRIENSRQPVLAFLFFTIQKLTLGGLILGLAIYLAGLSRSCLHESLTAFGRRHAVRLGRLYLYLKLGGLPARKLLEEKGNLDVENFVLAFGGQKEATTAFKEIKSEDHLGSNWFSTLANGLSHIPELVRKAKAPHD